MQQGNYFSPEKSLQKLKRGNETFRRSCRNPAYIARRRRQETAKGQSPYAIILTCSDSRVVPEHIFSAGLGDLFVVRTAGNVVGDFEIGSIDFAVDVLNAPLIVVMGHTDCGAVIAAMDGGADGYVGTVVDEIKRGLNHAKTESEAICNNVLHSRERLLQSSVITSALQCGTLMLVTAQYDLCSGCVSFFER